MKEVWKLILPNYEISSEGKIRNKNTKHILKQHIDNAGYYNIRLGNRQHYKIHRLVAMAFIPNPENKSEIDYIDGNKLNNNVNNLKWCTHKENMNNYITRAKMDKYYKSDRFNLKICNPMKDQIHRAHHKDIMYSRFSGGNNMTAKKVLDLNTNIEYGCIKEYAEAINIPVSTVRNWLNGIYKFKKGYSAIIKEG